MTRHSPSGRRALGLCLAGFAVFQWGTQPVLLALVVQSLEVAAVGWMRFAVTAALLLPLVLRRGGRELLRLRGRRLLLLTVCATGTILLFPAVRFAGFGRLDPVSPRPARGRQRPHLHLLPLLRPRRSSTSRPPGSAISSP